MKICGLLLDFLSVSIVILVGLSIITPTNMGWFINIYQTDWISSLLSGGLVVLVALEVLFNSLIKFLEA